MRLVTSVVLLLLTISALAGAAPRQKVGTLGDVNRMDFRGVRTFPADSIRLEVESSLPLLIASHPSAPRDEFLKVLANRIREGYLSAGFASARVTVRPHKGDKRILVEVQEGVRFQAGPVRVLGVPEQLGQHVVNRLTKPTPPRFSGERYIRSSTDDDNSDEEEEEDDESPLWILGKPAELNSI